MAPRESEIQKLRTQLQASRWQLHDGIQELEGQINVPRRIRNDLAEHPMRWALVGAAVGLAGLKVMSRLLRGAGGPWVRGLLPMALRAASILALPLLTTQLKAMAPSKAR